MCILTRGYYREHYAKPPTRACDECSFGTWGILVLCRLLGQSRVQSRLPTSAEGTWPHVSSIYRHRSLLGAGRSNGRRARPEAVSAIEYADADAQAFGNPRLYQAKPGLC